MVNIPANNFDIRISPNRGLISGSDRPGGLGFLENGNDNKLIDYFVSNTFKKEVYSSYSYHWMDFFATYN